MSETLWIFGYGSLMWEPGFDYAERLVARLSGYHRCFCLRSIHHRGTPAEPGLVLALDRQAGAVCDGVGFAVSPDKAAAVLAYLRERELISSAYLERMVRLVLADGRRVQALAFVVDPDHGQYCGGLALEEQARIIAGAVGGRGPNDQYLFNTADQLAALGLADADLDWLAARVRGIAQRASTIAQQ